MALDPFFHARTCPPEVLVAACQHTLERGFCVVPSAGDAEITLLRSALSRRGVLTPTAPSQVATDPYDVLDRFGVVAVAGTPHQGAIRLTGGSVSSCQLVIEGSSAYILKQVRQSALPALDSVVRHRLEANWIAALQTDGPGHLFPKIQSLDDADNGLTIRSEFLGCYTLGEWLLQRSDLGAASEDRRVVEAIFALLREDLYHRPGSRSAHSESYIEKARRRIVLVFSDSRIGQVAKSLFARGGTINGLRCRPLAVQLSALTAPQLDGTFNPAQRHACHGDLIPEDILVDRSGSVVAFVDPNPQNSDPLVDIGKFVMSCCTGYDLALRDWLEVVTEPIGDDTHSVTSLWSAPWCTFAARQADLGSWIANEAARLLPSAIAADARAAPEAVFVLAGLQAVCIVPFHLLHHNRPVRALHFLATGQALIERGLTGMGL